MKDDSKRCTNIELVRILFMLGIIIMHYLNPKMGGYLTYIQSNGKQADVALTYFMISISACAVNLFVLINGYFMCESYQRTVTKPVKLILQVIIFQTLPSIAGMFLGFHEFSVRGFIRTLVPANWYVILYIALYWISPYINIIIDVLDKKELLKFIYVVFAIFSIYPTVVDVLSEIIGHEIHGLSSVGMYGSQWGYSIVNFVLMYLIGAYIKRANIEKSPHYTGGGYLRFSY